MIGVLPQGFHFPPSAATDVALPMTLPALPPAQRKGGWTFSVGRLKPGQSIASVVSELEALSTEFAQAYPEQNRGTAVLRRTDCVMRWSATRSGRCCCCSARSGSCC